MRTQQRGQQYKLRFLDDADHLKLKEVAKKEDRSLNYLINQAIKKFLKESMKSTGTKKPCLPPRINKVSLPSLKDVNTCQI